jgi:peptidoglycan/LPS O-acetylase OafA/YrhL
MNAWVFLLISLVLMERGTYLPQLDGIRGLAILLVLATHLLAFEPIFAVARYGWTGVDLFFILSGFLITRILLRIKGTPGAYGVFLCRRALRIFPLYFLVLAAYVLYCRQAGVGSYFLSRQGYYWTYTTNFLISREGWGGSWNFLVHFWSLAIEEQFYFAWPLLALFTKTRFLVYLLCGVLVFSFLFRIFFTPPAPMFHNMCTLSRMDELAAGSLLATLLHLGKNVLRYSKVIFLAGTLGMALIIISEPRFNGESEIIQRYGYTAITLFFGGLLMLSLHTKRVAAFFRWALLRAAGKYAYGMYVFHYIFINILQAEFGLRHGPQLAALTLILTVSAAVASYHLLEKHMLRLKPPFATGNASGQ